jgi:hypothetical protein
VKLTLTPRLINILTVHIGGQGGREADLDARATWPELRNQVRALLPAGTVCPGLGQLKRAPTAALELEVRPAGPRGRPTKPPTKRVECRLSVYMEPELHERVRAAWGREAPERIRGLIERELTE